MIIVMLLMQLIAHLAAGHVGADITSHGFDLWIVAPHITAGCGFAGGHPFAFASQ